MHPRQAQQPIQVVLNPVVVMERVGLDEAGILAGVKAGTFPKPIKFDGRVVWKEPDIREWIAARIAAGDERVIALNRLSPAMERLIDALAEEYVKEVLAAPPSSQHGDPMSLCLSRDELAELTRCKLKRGQVAFLVKNGIRHYIDAHGWPVVTRAAVGIGVESEEKPVTKPWRPNKSIDL